MSFSSVFPGRVAVSPAEAAKAVFGWSPKTTANRLQEGNFPLPVVTLAGRRVCRLEDLEILLAGKPAGPVSPAAVAPAPKRGRGRPRKMARKG